MSDEELQARLMVTSWQNMERCAAKFDNSTAKYAGKLAKDCNEAANLLKEAIVLLVTESLSGGKPNGQV